MSLLSADTPASERRAPLPLEADTFWYGVGSATSQPPSSGLSLGEWAHLRAAMILLGVSLTSLILALTAGFAVSALLILASGAHVGEAFAVLYEGAFGNAEAILAGKLTLAPTAA